LTKPPFQTTILYRKADSNFLFLSKLLGKRESKDSHSEIQLKDARNFIQEGHLCSLIKQGIASDKLRRHLFLGIYGDDFDENVKKRIMARL